LDECERWSIVHLPYSLGDMSHLHFRFDAWSSRKSLITSDTPGAKIADLQDEPGKTINKQFRLHSDISFRQQGRRFLMHLCRLKKLGMTLLNHANFIPSTTPAIPTIHSDMPFRQQTVQYIYGRLCAHQSKSNHSQQYPLDLISSTKIS